MLRKLDRPRRALAGVVLTVALLAIAATPALAVTNGQPDGTDHPFVGLMVAQDANGNPLWRCSGTLLSDDVFLTAGHCTAPDGADNPEHVEIWFDTGPIPLAADYPTSTDPDNRCDGIVTGYPCVGDVGGTPYTNPDWNPDAFYVRDLGIVILDTPLAMSQYGTLPALNQLDAYARKGRKSQVTFTAVGYGLQKSFPTAAAWKNSAIRQRMVAHPKLNQINGGIVGDFSLLLSNNAHSGGTCFGDSGGPNFLGDSTVVAGVTSFGLNGNCAGTGGVFRVDRSWSLAFINDALSDGVVDSHYAGD